MNDEGKSDQKFINGGNKISPDGTDVNPTSPNVKVTFADIVKRKGKTDEERNKNLLVTKRLK